MIIWPIPPRNSFSCKCSVISLYGEGVCIYFCWRWEGGAIWITGKWLNKEWEFYFSKTFCIYPHFFYLPKCFVCNFSSIKIHSIFISIIKRKLRSKVPDLFILNSTCHCMWLLYCIWNIPYIWYSKNIVF